MERPATYRCYEIDHICLDMQVDESSFPVPGAAEKRIRPWLTICMDSRSRYVVASAVRDKRPDREVIAGVLCGALAGTGMTGYGVLPNEIRVDQSFLSLTAQQLFRELGIVVHSHTGNGASLGTMERFFYQLTLYTLSSSDRGRGQGRLSPYPTIADIHAVLDEWIPQYHHRVNPHTGKTPLASWQEHDGDAEKSQVDVRTLVMLLQEPVPRRVSKQGISYLGQLYWHGDLSHLVGKEVSVRARPLHTSTDPIEVFATDQWICSAYPTGPSIFCRPPTAFLSIYRDGEKKPSDMPGPGGA